MQKVSKFVYLLFFVVVFAFCVLYFGKEPNTVNAQATGVSDAFPQFHLNCASTKDVEFQSLRPYQAAPCGDASKAVFCSNKLKFIEDLDVTDKGDCHRTGSAGVSFCNPDVHVEKHNLYVSLDKSQFPIMGNTEDVINHTNTSDTINDATKVNEYVSWYLNGVTDKFEKKDSTNDDIVNLSGPIKKLLPSVLQDAQRIKIIEDSTKVSSYIDEETGKTVKDAENHDQLVVDKERLSSWKGDLSFLRALLNKVSPIDAWNKREPPLPWSDKDGKPFKSDVLFRKAYNEWLGKSCSILPFVGLTCFDNPLIPNKYADLWKFVPLANTTDKKGANFLITVDGPSYDAAQGTIVENAQHEAYTNAPLYFAHTQEVKDLSEQLNKTYTPANFKSKKVPATTEVNDCSSLVVRTNKGDNLFPGDVVELSVTGAEYDLKGAKCVETEGHYVGDMKNGVLIKKWVPGEFKCNAEVAIILDLDVKVPFADDIFATTVADSGSTFRKIYPKVGEGAPVSCIADIPTTTGVTYDPAGSQLPKGGGQTGTQEFKIQRYPKDSGGETPELTFPHIGAVYEYFLKGIQAALRPQGYGEQPVSGEFCSNMVCGELPKTLPKATGACALGSVSPRVSNIPKALKDIVSAAGQTYKVPPNLILGVMFGEGAFNLDSSNKYSKYDWTDANVKNWATCTKLPNCTDETNSVVPMMGWDKLSEKVLPDLKKIDPNRKKMNPCNLMDMVFVVAKNLSEDAGGSAAITGKSCLGIKMTSTTPTSCDWKPDQYATAIRVWEFGVEWGPTSNGFLTCATKAGSCATGGSLAAQCDKDTGTGPGQSDRCDNSVQANSHMGCLFEVGHGK